MRAGNAGDTVRVAIKFNPAIYFGPITITQPITLAGGWNVSPTPSGLLWQRPSPCEASRTTIDAQGTGRAVSIANHVDARVDCFTVTGGDATGQGGSGIGYDVGGGIYGYYGDTVVSSCIITGNVASRATIGWGGGVGFFGGNVSLDGNVIQGNTASTASSGYGGGVYLRQMSSATVSGNKLLDNVGSTVGFGYGGGIAAHFGSATLQENNVYGNRTKYGGACGPVGPASRAFVLPSATAASTRTQPLPVEVGSM